MNFIELPVFILFLAFMYLMAIYGLLKMAETQSNQHVVSNSQDNSQRIKIQENLKQI